jgi:antitoxin (DNA-binding transcriptional repressor) of toxin-antitoxin stability system
LAPGWQFCAERLESGFSLEAIRRRIATRAGLAGCHAADAAEPGIPEGRIDSANPTRISGWAFDPARPHTRLHLQILVDDEPVATLVANAPRPDLQRAGKGDGNCAFSYRFATALATDRPRMVSIRVVNGPVLASRIVVSAPDECGPLVGRIDATEGGVIEGWAFDPLWPGLKMRLSIVRDGREIAQVVADRPCADLAAAGIADGCCGFRFESSPADDHCTIVVRRTADDVVLGVVSIETGAGQRRRSSRRAA